MWFYRNKRQRGSMQSLSAITAALHSEDEDSDADADPEADNDDVPDEQNEEEDADNPRWQLYNMVRTYTNSQGG